MDRRLVRSSGMRRSLIALRTGLLGLAAVTTTALTVSAAAHAESAQTQLQANRRAAAHDARRLLARLQLPPADATSPPTIPPFAQSFETSSAPARRYYASAERWELTSARPEAIIAYVRRHRPAGSTEDLGSGSSRDSKTGVTSIDVQFSWPEVPGRIVNRSLTVTVITPRRGHSVVLAQSQSAWYVPRPAAESVPAGVHAVAITVRLGPPATGPVVRPGGTVHTSTHFVAQPAAVASLIKTFDGLPIVQPSLRPLGCPMILTGSSASQLSLAFMTGRHGRTLARAQVYIHRGAHSGDGAGPCNPIEFSIGGRQQTALTSPTFVQQIGRLVGVAIS
jgi:hypothetical protein